MTMATIDTVNENDTVTKSIEQNFEVIERPPDFDIDYYTRYEIVDKIIKLQSHCRRAQIQPHYNLISMQINTFLNYDFIHKALSLLLLNLYNPIFIHLLIYSIDRWDLQLIFVK